MIFETVVAYRKYYTHKAKEWLQRGMTMKWYGRT
jgi:hypothetical protein